MSAQWDFHRELRKIISRKMSFVNMDFEFSHIPIDISNAAPPSSPLAERGHFDNSSRFVYTRSVSRAAGERAGRMGRDATQT
jgi:hypothetical protein